MRPSTALPAGFLAFVLLGGASPTGCGSGASTDATALANGTSNSGHGEKGEFRARLIGFRETPAVSTTGKGTFGATLSEDGTTLTFELTYADLQGLGEGGSVTGAHIHLGQRDVPGGIAVNLCGAGGRPACPAPPATVTGTIMADDVVGPVAQGIAPKGLADLLRAARAGVTYVNVHTTGFPTGEIRGQIRAHRDRDEDDERDDDD